jgi:hypothetical protein
LLVGHRWGSTAYAGNCIQLLLCSSASGSLQESSSSAAQELLQ